MPVRFALGLDQTVMAWDFARFRRTSSPVTSPSQRLMTADNNNFNPMPPLPAQILMTCGTDHAKSKDYSACVEWAAECLCEGLDSPSLRILAGLLPPFETLEIRDYTIRTLRELGIEVPRGPAAITAISRVYILDIVRQPELMQARLRDLCDLCIAEDYRKDIFDFYLLYWALDHLQEEPVQWYWEGADRTNINNIVLQRCRSWLQHYETANVV